MPDLETFAKKNPPRRGGPKCWACSLPIDRRLAVDEARGTYTAHTVASWLLAEGVEGATKQKIERHWREHVR